MTLEKNKINKKTKEIKKDKRKIKHNWVFMILLINNPKNNREIIRKNQSFINNNKIINLIINNMIWLL